MIEKGGSMKSKSLSMSLVTVALLVLAVSNIFCLVKLGVQDSKIKQFRLLLSQAAATSAKQEKLGLVENDVKILWELVGAHQKWLELLAGSVKTIGDEFGSHTTRLEAITAALKKQGTVLLDSVK